MATEDVKLSKNVLRMKFMHKSAIRIEREKNEEEQQKFIDDDHWVMDLPECQTKESKFQKDMGYVFCEELEFGRHSFKGFNVEVEKLMKMYRAKKLEEDTEGVEKKEEEGEQDNVNEEEMANRYNTLIGVIAKKFTKKRHRVTKEEERDETLIDELPPNKFIKPTLED